MPKTSKNKTKLYTSVLLCPLLCNAAFAADLNPIAEAVDKVEKAASDPLGEQVDVDFYGSIRFGADLINANIEQDGANGRDFLSRVGVKATYNIDDRLAFIGQIEYGTRSDVVDVFQNGGLGLRQFNVGFKHKDYGTVKFGSQTTTFHKFVRGAYFSDGLDTIRLATIREDDYLSYDYKSGPFRFGAGLQIEGQDGDNIDQFQIGAEYTAGPFKLQGAYVLDNEGDNQGDLYGVRAWWKVNENITLSAYHHEQDEAFDFPSGVGSTGALRLRARDGGLGNINFVTTCVGQTRSASGVYGSARVEQHQFHARYAVDSCDTAGDVESIKAEYVYHFDKNLRSWISYEQLQTDTDRTPAAFGDTFSSVQFGVRLDF